MTENEQLRYFYTMAEFIDNISESMGYWADPLKNGQKAAIDDAVKALTALLEDARTKFGLPK